MNLLQVLVKQRPFQVLRDLTNDHGVVDAGNFGEAVEVMPLPPVDIIVRKLRTKPLR